MPPLGFEPTISAGERLHTYVSPRGHWDRRVKLVTYQNYTKMHGQKNIKY